jgi:hypothetical protein
MDCYHLKDNDYICWKHQEEKQNNPKNISSPQPKSTNQNNDNSLQENNQQQPNKPNYLP